jgi:hypothetical protein
MKQAITRVLQRSSDAIIVIRLADATVLGANEVFASLTGHPQRMVVGRPSGELIGRLGAVDGAMAVAGLRDRGSTMDALTALWTGSGDLRVGQLAALVVEVEGQRDAICAIRGIRDPSPAERRLVARQELQRIVHGGGAWPDAGAGALEAFGKCLGWQFGAFWSADAASVRLRCAAVWRAPTLDLEQLEQASWEAAFEPGDGLLGQVWRSGKPAWVGDASSDPGFRQRGGGAGAPVGGWLGFPAWGADGVVGVVEFISVEPRQPDEQLLTATEQFGRLFGRLVDNVGGEDAALDVPGPGSPDPHGSVSGTVSDALRNLVDAVGAMTEALARHPVSPAQIEPPALLQGLVAGIGEFTRFLEDAIDPDTDASLARGPSPPSPAPLAAAPEGLPTGLTLKAVSQRTGIPAATLRTWERRYGFLQPTRSPSGYRLYGEEELARIQQVKYLLDQGVRIGEAMAAVIGAAGPSAPTGGGQPGVGETEPGQDTNEAERRRISPRSPRGHRP